MALKLKHRWQRIVFKFILIPAAIILLLAVIVNHYWSPILGNKVRDIVLTSSDSLYKIDFSDAELRVLEGKIVIYNITLKPDTAIYNKKMKQHLAPNNLVELRAKRLILLHVHPFSLYFRKKLNIGQIILNEPEVNISYQRNHTKDTTTKDHRTAWQRISNTLHSIHVGHIYLNDIKLKYEDYSGNKVAISELKELSVSAYNLLIDSTTQLDRTRLLYCKELVTELNNYSGQTPSGLYAYKIKHLKLSTLTSQLNLEGLQIEPAKTSVFFGKSQKDRFNVNIDSLQLNDFDYLSYHKYRTMHASNLMIDGGTISVYTNPNKIPHPEVDKIISFPQQLIHKLNTDLRIDTTRLHHIDIFYSEVGKKSKQTGSISFNNTSGHLYNITTNSDALQKNHMADVAVSTLFMNRGRLDVQFAFNLTDPGSAFTYKGVLGSMNLSALNPAVMPLAMVKVTSGRLKKFAFDIQANSKVFKGKVDFLYNDMKVAVLKADTVNNRLQRQMLLSIFANLFVLKHNNPDNDTSPSRSAYVIYTRPKDSPFFKTMWKTLLTGIKPCVGVDAKMQEKTKARINEHEENKKERMKRKAERQKQRAEKKRLKELEKKKG